MCHHHQYLAQNFITTLDRNSAPIKQPLLTPTPHHRQQPFICFLLVDLPVLCARDRVQYSANAP